MAFKKNWIYTNWNILIFIATLIVAVDIPIHLAFKTHLAFNLSKDTITLLFLLDFIIKVSLYRKHKNKAEYLELSDKSWYNTVLLATDLLAAIPFFLLIPVPAIQLLRLFKLARVIHHLRNLQERVIQHAGTYIFSLFFFWFMLATHWLACGWQGLSIIPLQSDFASDYINSVYWTITTLTTVGYGDITPITNPQKIYAIMVQVLGFGVFTFIIGTVASQLMRKDPARTRYEENIEGLASLMHYKTLPGHLKTKIINFYKYMWEQRLGYDESTFLESLPENLQTEVALYLKKEVIEKVSLFHDASSEFKREISLLLKPVFLTPGDYIFKAGDIGYEMYFVVDGELNTLTLAEDRTLTTLKAGDFFGEIALFKNQNRSATVKALTYCDIYSLDKSAFNKVISKYPKIGSQIQSIVEKRESKYSVE